MVAFLQVISVLTQVTYEFMIDCIAVCHNQIPYHTSVLSGEGWVQELITGHPQRMRTELGVHQSTFIVLSKLFKMLVSGHRTMFLLKSKSQSSSTPWSQGYPALMLESVFSGHQAWLPSEY